jgi:RNA polymerase sigma factor (sigma-70 family)
MHAVDTRGAGKRITAEKIADPIFADYLKQAERYKLLTAAEERSLGDTLQRGNRRSGDIGPWMTTDAYKARERLICSNLMLVVSIAACYTFQGVPLADIVQAGNIGLITATDKYVPGRARFATYAGWWIARECGNLVLSTGSVMRVPRDVATNIRRISRATRRMETDAVEPDTERLAEETMLTPSQVRNALKARELQDTVSLDTPVADASGHADNETLTVADLIADDRMKPAETRTIDQLDTGDLYRKMARILTARERIVLALRYGLGELSGVTMTNQQVGQQLDMSEDAAGRVVKMSLDKLRDAYGIVFQDTGIIAITATTVIGVRFTDAS